MNCKVCPRRCAAAECQRFGTTSSGPVRTRRIARWKGASHGRSAIRARDFVVGSSVQQQTIIRLAATAGNADPAQRLNPSARSRGLPTGGGAIGAVGTGRPAARQAWLGYRASPALRDPANRALLKQPARPIADS